MRMKVGKKWYDTKNSDIIMVEFSDEDKENIANMLKECSKYCSYKPRTFTEDEVNEFMELSQDTIELVSLKSLITDEHM